MSQNLKAEELTKLKQTSFKIGLIEVVAGILLFSLPLLLPSIIMMTMGIVFIFISIVSILVLSRKPKEMVKLYSYLLPIGLLILGVYTIINPSNVVTVIAWIFGVGTVLKGVAVLLSLGSPLKTQGYKIAGAFAIIIGLVIIFASSSAGELFSYYIGFSLLFHGIIDIYSAYDLGKLVKEVSSDQYVTD